MNAFKVTLSMCDYPYLVIAEDIEDVIPTLNAQSNLFPYQFHNFYIDKIEKDNRLYIQLYHSTGQDTKG